MKKTRWLSLVLSMMVFHAVIGQIYDNSFNPVAETSKMAPTPNSPEVQAFTKYGDVPVSMYNGTPNIQVPLFVFNGRELDLPISLTYDASGIKVEQLASSVGLGWNLNVGGRVSRITNGLPDDFISGGNTNIPYKSIWDSEVQDAIALYHSVNGGNPVFQTKDSLLNYMVFLKKVNDNEYDTQPDYFSFNALGNNETFVIDVATGTPKALNNPRMIVQVVKGYGAANPITKWVITSDDGTVYHFEQAEVTRDVNVFNAGQSNFYGFKKEYNSSWLLTKIVSATGKDTYDFEYTDLGFWNNNRKAATYNGVTNVVGCIPNLNDPSSGGTNTPNPTQPMGYTGGNDYKIKQLVLNKIKHNDKTIVSVNTIARSDMSVNSAIADIDIFKDYNEATQVGDPLKSFHFNYDYFKTSPSLAQPYNPLLVRLKLDQIEIKGNNGVTENSYSFDYIDPYSLPSTTSKAQDYYGYYNGKESNTVLYPKAPVGPCSATDGADRTPNSIFAKKGLLSRITYPTGGHSEFSYEPNYEKVVSGSSTNWTLVAGIDLTNGNLPSSNSTVCNSDVLGSVTPSTTNDTFAVTTSGDYRLVYSHLGSPGRNYTVNHVATLIKIPSATSTLSWGQIYDSNCNVKPGVDVIWSTDLIDGVHLPSLVDPNLTTITHDTSLSSGYYQLVLANPFGSFTNSLDVNRSESSTNYTYQERAGLRVESIKDYTDLTTVAKQTHYEYPSGTVISEPIYQYVSDQYTTDASQNVITSQILHRLSYASSTTRAHVGYSEVKEVSIDFNDPTKSLNTTHKFHTTSYGNYRDGVYTYYIDGKETAKQYSVSYELGKPQATENYDSAGNLVLKSSQTYYDLNYYSNTGIYLMSDESKSHLYPIPTQDLLGNYYIDYVDPIKIPAVGTGAGGVAVVPPAECNTNNFGIYVDQLCTPAMARLVKHNVSSYGKVGNTIQSRNMQYFNAEADKIEQTTTYKYYDQTGQGYAVNYLLKEQQTTDSHGDVVKQEFEYPQNKNYTNLVSKNMLNIPVQTRVYKDGNLLSNKSTDFTGSILPNKIQVAKAGQNLEDRLIFERYQNNNLVQLRQVDGTTTAYVWGHNSRYIVAKVENATYGQIENLSEFGTGFSIAGDLSSGQESQLRGLSGAMVTTYTYQPLVGVKTITDPRGNIMSYQYDSMNRLVLIKDQDGNVISENQYNYKN